MKPKKIQLQILTFPPYVRQFPRNIAKGGNGTSLLFDLLDRLLSVFSFRRKS